LGRDLIKLVDVGKSFQGRRVLNRVNLEVGASEITVIRGRSGAGKTTLLKLIALLIKPDEGRVFIEGLDVWSLREGERTRLASNAMSYIPQSIDLIPSLSVRENIELPALIRGVPKSVRERALQDVIGLLGLSNILERRVGTLSGGEKQMVALARSLVNKPKLVVADEPFAYVDDAGVETLFGVVRDLRDRLGTSFIITTTELYLKSFSGDKEYFLVNGSLTRV
jgi:ABC-type lipoprotein export system ATPase subunit